MGTKDWLLFKVSTFDFIHPVCRGRPEDFWYIDLEIVGGNGGEDGGMVDDDDDDDDHDEDGDEDDEDDENRGHGKRGAGRDAARGAKKRCGGGVGGGGSERARFSWSRGRVYDRAVCTVQARKEKRDLVVFTLIPGPLVFAGCGCCASPIRFSLRCRQGIPWCRRSQQGRRLVARVALVQAQVPCLH